MMRGARAEAPAGAAQAARRDELAARLAMLDGLRREVAAELDALGGRAGRPSGAPRLTSLKEAARLIGRHPDTLRRWLDFDTFAARVGGRTMVDLDRFEPVLRAHFPKR